MFPFQDYWSQLRDGTRDQIIGGLILAIILALVAIFRKILFDGIRRFISTVDPPPAQAAPQPVVVKVESIQPVLPESAPPALAPRPVLKSQIPRPPIAGFVARRDESGREIVERLKEELSPQKEQLIVLWGAGGVGKTTLAAETARAMRAIFDGGIVWTSADGKPDFSLSTLLDDIAAHLGRPEFRQLAPAAKDIEVHNALSKAHDTLIVLDNFETVSPEEQEKCAGWLANRASCPALITSRDEVSHARPVRILAMSQTEAQEFLRRLISEAHNPRVFEPLDHEQIIKAADRIPRVLQWVVKQIDSAKQPHVVLDELSHGRGDAAERVFDRSFDLAQVGADGRAVLLALSLFVPDASRRALANVAGLDNVEKGVEKPLQQLLELWLVQTSENNERVRVEGLTRELAQARLNKTGSSQEYSRRYVAYFHQYAQEHAAPEPENYELLETERDNLLSAMDLAFELENWETVQAFANIIALPVTGMLGIRGYWAQALKANQQALEAARRSNSEFDVVVFAHNLAVMHGHRGELVEARKLYNESLARARKLGDERSIAITLHQLALLAHEEGELAEARRLYDGSLELARKLGNQSGIADTLHQLGMLAQHEGKLEEARRVYDESLEISRKLDTQSGIAPTLHQLAVLAQIQGQFAEARQLYNEALEIARKVGIPSLTATTLHQMALLMHQQGASDEARQLYNESLTIKRKLGDQLGIAITLNTLGHFEEAEGNPKEAACLFREALVILEKLNSRRVDDVRQSLERVSGHEQT